MYCIGRELAFTRFKGTSQLVPLWMMVFLKKEQPHMEIKDGFKEAHAFL